MNYIERMRVKRDDINNLIMRVHEISEWSGYDYRSSIALALCGSLWALVHEEYITADEVDDVIDIMMCMNHTEAIKEIEENE